MKRSILGAVVALAFAWSIIGTTTSAMADQKSPFTITLTPVWDIGTTSDAQALPPPGTVPLNSPLQPPSTDDIRLNYGISYAFSKKSSLSYSHSNIGFELGRILTLAPGTSLDTGDIIDRIDTISYNYGFGHGLSASAYYLSHQRIYVAGLCLNQEDCPGNNSNPKSVNMEAYGIGFKYGFGPVSKFTGPLLTVNADAQYIPRSANLPMAPALYSYNGINNYVASGQLFPYGITMNIPVPATMAGLIPFVDYKRESVWWRAENTPEMFNVIDFGIVKVIRPNLTLALVDTHFNGCLCSDTVPPPDNINFSDVIMSLSYSFKP
jgi:hypothetical protein